MTLDAPTRCSAVADALDEPMIGSVEQRTRWLLIEDRSAWGSDAVKDVLGPELPAAAKARGVRVLLIKRREGDPSADATRRAILVDVVERRAAERQIADLAELDLSEITDAPVEAFGRAVTDPIFLVCTNGKRDACCALRGRALMAALAVKHGDRTWECTHLGGHRFAGNLVCLPDGIVYGRVAPADGPRLASAYLDGVLDPSLLRGRSAWPAPAQVAEQHLRLGAGLGDLDDVTMRECEVADGSARVILADGDGTLHRFELQAERLEPQRAVSCAGDKIEAPVHWRVTPGATL